MVNMLKSSLREIKQSLGRFLAILAIVGLGVGFFAGLRMCEPAMLKTGRDFLMEQKFHDFQLMSSLGYTSEDVDAFAKLPGIAAARGSVFTDVLALNGDDQEIVLKFHTLTDDINVPYLTAGRMPERGNECLGDARFFSEDSIGSTIRISSNNKENTLDLLNYDTYTITGLMFSPEYLNYERGTSSVGSGMVAAFVYVPEEGMDTDVFFSIYLTAENVLTPYTEEYDASIEELEEAVKELNRERSTARYEKVSVDAKEEIANGEQELQDGWDEYHQERTDVEKDLADAYGELLDGEDKYQTGLHDLDKGKADYEQGVRDLAKAQTELEDARIRLEDAKSELSSAHAQLTSGENQWKQVHNIFEAADKYARQFGFSEPLELFAFMDKGTKPEIMDAVREGFIRDGTSMIEVRKGFEFIEKSIKQPLSRAYMDSIRKDLDDGWKEYNDGLAEYEDGYAEYQSGLIDYEKGVADLAKAKEELAKAPSDLETARKDLDDGWKEYEDGTKEAKDGFADAEKELWDGEKKLQDARDQLEAMREANIYTLTRNENKGYAAFDSDSAIVAAISLVFPVFFFLVAALVCMTTMTRMVDEQRTQIGVLKALGYSNSQIMGKYLFYSGSAATIGSMIGYALGTFALPRIIWEIYGIMYGFAPLKTVSRPILLAVSFAAALICSMGATYLACRKELCLPAAQLIRPKTPKAGRRVFLEYITPIWNRLSFLRKVSFRNVFRYRSRLVMMVLGIGGCTALLVTGFGIRDSIKYIGDDQFNEITVYDYGVNFKEAQDPDSIAAYLDEVGWDGEDSLLLHTSSTEVITEEGKKSAFLMSSYTGEFDGFVDLHAGETHIDAPEPGEAVVNIGMAEGLGISVGDTITVDGDDFESVEVVVSAICDNFVQNFIYIHPDTFADQTGYPLAFKTLYLLAHEGADPYKEGTILGDSDDVGNVAVNADIQNKVITMLARMDYIVLVVVVCAAALAFIVLYNLTNINITERIREIATIKVLGFYRREVAAYVFREINMLSLLGSLVGLLMGKALHMFVMDQIQIDSVYFPCRIAPLSYLMAFLMTMIFTLVISTAMRPRLSRIDMAESLKSIE